jgi:hypothetical protein
VTYGEITVHVPAALMSSSVRTRLQPISTLARELATGSSQHGEPHSRPFSPEPRHGWFHRSDAQNVLFAWLRKTRQNGTSGALVRTFRLPSGSRIPGGRRLMIVAATKDGVHDVDTGDVMLVGHDVGFLARCREESWVLAERGRTVLRALDGGDWEEVARVEGDAGIVLHPLGNGGLLVGTRGAHVFRLEDGELRRLDSFDAVPGRDDWQNPASSAPDVWTFASEGDSVFVSVHVGGVWRSDDRGDTWTNVLEPEVDVHQVTASDGLVAVAAQGGFGTSRDRGRTWSWTTDGLHAPYLQTVAITGDSVSVGASSGPFGTDAAVYQASPPGAAFERRSAGLPETFAAIGPHHLAADGAHLAVTPWNSTDVWTSRDAGRSWDLLAKDLPKIRSLAVSADDRRRHVGAQS